MKIMNLAAFGLSYQFKRVKLNYYPFFFWIEPTNCCNLKCLTCPQSLKYGSPKGYMEIETFRRIIDEIIIFSPMMISLHLGGESLLHEDLPEMIRLSKERGIDVTLASNATLLTEEKSTEIIEAGIDGITVNFSSNKGEFEKYFIGAKWEKVYKNIRDFLRIKKKLGKPKPIFSIQVLNINNDDILLSENIKKLKHLFLDLPFDSIMNVPAHNWSGDFADRSIGQVRYEFKKDKSKYFPCQHLWSSVVVRWNGDVVPCCRDLQGEVVLGNINDKCLVDIWNGRKLVELRKKHREFKYYKISICKNCSKLWEGTKPYNLFFKHISKIPLKIKARF